VLTAITLSANGLPRILHLVETLEIGGTETQVVQTALCQHSRRQFVTVGCLRAEGPLVTRLQSAGVPIVEFRKKKKLLSVQGVSQLLRLALFLRRQRFDVLHAHDIMSNLLGIPAARLAGTPVTISSRRHLADLDWWQGPVRNRVTRWIYGLSTHVVVNSTSIRDLLVARDGVRGEKIRVIYNGVDVHQFVSARRDKESLLPGVKKHAKLIAVVANLSPVKGHASLIVAASTVCRDYPDAIFLLIGDGQERPKLKQQVKELGLEKNFRFLGARTDVPQVLACCDLSVLPSESEGLPNSVLEAMAAGLPVVATSVGGMPELIDNEVNGLLVPPHRPDALSAAILRLLKDVDLRRRFAGAAHDSVVTRFSFARLIDRLGTLYTELPEPVRFQRDVPASL